MRTFIECGHINQDADEASKAATDRQTKGQTDEQTVGQTESRRNVAKKKSSTEALHNWTLAKSYTF